MRQHSLRRSPAVSEQTFEPIRKGSKRREKGGGSRRRGQSRREQRAAKAAQRAELERLARDTGFDLPGAA